MEKHVHVLHNLPRPQWLCSGCEQRFPTKHHVANDFSRAHPSTSTFLDSEDEGEEEDTDAGVFKCLYCE